MKLVVRRVSPVEVRQELLDLLQRNLGISQERIFDWRYTMNPAGQTWCWFAYEGNGSSAVAMTSLFPRRMHVDGNLVTCGQVTHFVIEPAYRSLGPALLLQRATFEPVDSGEVAFCYDCPPHDQGMSTFLRLGMKASCEVTRYTLLLRSDEFFHKRLGKGRWTKPLTTASNLALRMRKKPRPVPGLEISEHEGTFGAEFSELDRQVSSAGVVRASRSAEDLQWRYRQDPGSADAGVAAGLADDEQGEYRILAARKSGELLAFLALQVVRETGVAHILDLFGFQPHQVGAALLESAVDICRKRNLHSLYGFCSEQSELDSLFRRRGFLPRERIARVVVYENQEKKSGKLLNASLRWTFGQAEVRL
jgi:GNAT superfamily N-acetyltransferase